MPKTLDLRAISGPIFTLVMCLIKILCCCMDSHLLSSLAIPSFYYCHQAMSPQSLPLLLWWLWLSHFNPHLAIMATTFSCHNYNCCPCDDCLHLFVIAATLTQLKPCHLDATTITLLQSLPPNHDTFATSSSQHDCHPLRNSECNFLYLVGNGRSFGTTRIHE